jgi:hypothetical protein
MARNGSLSEIEGKELSNFLNPKCARSDCDALEETVGILPFCIVDTL